MLNLKKTLQEFIDQIPVERPLAVTVFPLMTGRAESVTIDGPPRIDDIAGGVRVTVQKPEVVAWVDIHSGDAVMFSCIPAPDFSATPAHADIIKLNGNAIATAFGCNVGERMRQGDGEYVVYDFDGDRGFRAQLYVLPYGTTVSLTKALK